MNWSETNKIKSNEMGYEMWVDTESNVLESYGIIGRGRIFPRAPSAHLMSCWYAWLRHWGRDKMAAIFQTTYQNGIF